MKQILRFALLAATFAASVTAQTSYADEIVRASALLNETADIVQKDDAEFAGYLRNRSRDLLSDDYESGDAVWVTARFKHLNGQMGSYETYDDGERAMPLPGCGFVPL